MDIEALKEKLIGKNIEDEMDLPSLPSIQPIDYFRARAGNVSSLGPGYTLRVVKKDGQDLPVTKDFRPTRINVEVINNKIVDVVGLF